MHQQVFSKIGIAGNMQFEWISLHQMPMHDNPPATVIVRRGDGYQ
jgi:hypothetical protein